MKILKNEYWDWHDKTFLEWRWKQRLLDVRLTTYREIFELCHHTKEIIKNELYK